MLHISSPVNAQTVTLTGMVTDQAGDPLPGVTVVVSGQTSVGTSTGKDGTYSLRDVPPGATISFSFIGYKTVEVLVEGRTRIDIQLQEDVTAIDEVIINAGYYSVKDRERTGSIVKVTAKEIENQPVNNPLAALMGRVTGVDIVENSGTPGGGLEIKIRGTNSIASGNEALYIIDGVPYDINTLGSKSISGPVLPGGVINPLNTLDPSSIESIEILKDADATAIYGSRGANGVVLITTKKGSTGKTSFKVDASGSFISVTRLPELLNTNQYLEMRREAYNNDGYNEYPYTAYDINGTWDQDRYTDWQKALIGGTARNNTVRASISGGNEQTRFNTGATYMKETTVFPMDFNYRKTSVFANINHNSADKRFSLQLTANYGIDKNFLPKTDLTSVSRTLPPNAPELYTDYGSLNWENSTWTNPLAALECTYRNSTNNLISNVVLHYKILKGLEIKTSFGYNRSDLTEIQSNPHTMYSPARGLTSASSYSKNNKSKRDSWIIEPQLNASYDIGNGNLNVTVGSTFQEQNMEQLSLQANGFTNDYFITTFSAGSTQTIKNEESSQYRYEAVYARINYNLRDKYFLNLTSRCDGSSRFGPDRRFANFGAIGAAWLFSEENFIKDNPWLSFGKIRASYGTTGNDQIGDYQYLNTYTITTSVNYNGYTGLTPSHLLNPEFAWERNRKVEAALEAGLWNNRLSFEIAYYNNRSDNQLIGTQLPGTTGFNSITSNLDATVENSGWEVSLRSVIVQREFFQWSTLFNLTVPKNVLVSFPGLEGSSYESQYEIGCPLSIYKLYKLTGVNTETGLFEFKDFNGDGVITSNDDRQFIADLTPRFYGNVMTNLRYRNWTLDLLFQFVKKSGLNEFYNTSTPGKMYNQPSGVLDSWQEEGDQATMQAYTTGYGIAYTTYSRFTVSDGIISDASFIRLKSLSLSYKLPFEKAGIENCVLYIQGQNLLTFTKFKNGDPEQLTGFLPPVKRISFGIRVEL